MIVPGIRAFHCNPPHYAMSQAGHTALYWAVRNSHVDALRTLLAAGANPAAQNNVRVVGASKDG